MIRQHGDLQQGRVVKVRLKLPRRVMLSRRSDRRSLQSPFSFSMCATLRPGDPSRAAEEENALSITSTPRYSRAIRLDSSRLAFWQALQE